MLLASLSAGSAAQVPEYHLKAEFLERFSRFIEWPTAGVSEPASFVICSYAANPFGTYTEEMAGTRRVKGRPIEFRTLTQLEGAAECQILFLPITQNAQLAAILARTAGKPILTVAESEGAAERGFLVNFYSSEENLRFEINDSASRRSGLKISSKLLKLARVVNLEESR